MSNIKNMIEGASDIAMDGILSRKTDREVTDEVFDFIWASVGMEEDAKFHAIDMAASIVKDVRKEYRQLRLCAQPLEPHLCFCGRGYTRDCTESGE